MKTLDRCMLTIVAAIIAIYLVYSISNYSTDKGLMEGISNKINLLTYRPDQVLERRAYQVNDYCHKNPKLMSHIPKNADKLPDYLIQSYLVNEDRSELYCPVPKCGWSSWRTMFFEDYGPSDYKRILTNMSMTGWSTPWQKVGLKVHTITESLELKNKNIKHRMVFVRNPYDRLVSAYKDKALRDDGLYVKREKLPCKWIKPNTPILSFPQFVQCIIDNVKDYSDGDLESFDAAESLDMHWRPQSLLCNVCTINYNIVGHFDHMSPDMKEAAKKLNLKSQPSWDNAASRHKSLKEWYVQLNQQQLDDLKKIYKYDFEILGFDPTAPS